MRAWAWQPGGHGREEQGSMSGAFPGCRGGKGSIADAHCFSGRDSLKTLPCANRRLWKFRAGTRNSERKQNFELKGSLEHQTHWLSLVPEPAGAPGRIFLGNLADISSLGRWLGEINPKSCHCPGKKGGGRWEGRRVWFLRACPNAQVLSNTSLLAELPGLLGCVV